MTLQQLFRTSQLVWGGDELLRCAHTTQSIQTALVGVQETRGKQEQHRAPLRAALHHPTWANSLAGKTGLLQEAHCRNSGRKDRGQNNVAQACRRNWQGSLGAGGDSSDTATSQHGARGC